MRMRRAPLAGLALAAALTVAFGRSAPANEPLIADLSNDEIDITTGFAGSELLLFGAKPPGGDVVVVIRGPARDIEVRRRERVAGIWVNGAPMTFHGVPAFYNVSATAPLPTIAPAETLVDRVIGLDSLPLAAATSASPEASLEYRRALVRNKTRAGLYSYEPTSIRIVGERLFRTAVAFPSNVPTGPYRVDIYLFADGREIGRHNATLVVRKAGLEAGIFNFAQNHSALYGICAILIALGFGWLAGVIFRS